MGREEQHEEREVLSSIFPDEITDLSEHSFRVTITLDDSVQHGDIRPPEILLTVTFPQPYPDVGPELELSAPPNAPKHPFFDISSDKSTLLSALLDTVKDNLGMQMTFTLVSTLKESAESLITERQTNQEKLREAEAQKVEEEENQKFQGERVTQETFLRWREDFRRELAELTIRKLEEREAEEKRKRGGAIKEEKLTGKMLWERGLVGKGDEEEGIDDT